MIFRIIAHASLLIHMGHDLESMIENLVNHKEKFPSLAEFETLLTDAIEFLGAGILMLPDDVAAKIAAALTGVKDEVSKLAAVPA